MADAKVAILNVVPVDRTGAPQKNVIEGLETMLARARTGNIQSFVIAYETADECAGHMSKYGTRPGGDFVIAAGLLMAQHELGRRMVDLSHEPRPVEGT